MALIVDDHPASMEDSKKFWEDALKNARILYFEIDKAIYNLSRDDKKSYSMDTGQNSINVTRHDLPSLLDRRQKLRKEIEELEEKLGVSDSAPVLVQGVPGW